MNFRSPTPTPKYTKDGAETSLKGENDDEFEPLESHRS